MGSEKWEIRANFFKINQFLWLLGKTCTYAQSSPSIVVEDGILTGRICQTAHCLFRQLFVSNLVKLVLTDKLAKLGYVIAFPNLKA